MRRCDKSQTNQDEVLDDCYYITLILVTSTSKTILLQLPFFSNNSFIKRGNYLLKGNFQYKPIEKLLNYDNFYPYSHYFHLLLTLFLFYLFSLFNYFETLISEDSYLTISNLLIFFLLSAISLNTAFSIS